MPETVKVLEVTEISLSIYKTNPPILNIHAEGVVRTSGYTNGRLVPYVYVMPPRDGIWDFDFVADKPDDPAKQVLCPIATDYMWHNYPEDLKGVRIHSSTNSLEKMLTESREKILKSDLVDK